MKKYTFLIFRAAISVLLIYFIIRSVDFSALSELVKNASFFWGLLGFAAVLLAMAVGAYKWQMLANSVYETTVPFASFLKYSFIGFFYSMFAPGGLAAGEVMKGWRVAAGETQKSKLVLSILVDRITGFISLGVLLTAAFYLNPSLQSDKFALSGLAVSLVVFAFGAALVLHGPFLRFLFFLAKFPVRFMSDTLVPQVARFQELFLVYHGRKKLIIWSVVVSGFIHFLWGAGIYFAGLALGIAAPLSYLVWIYLISGILFFVPVTYAGFGTREWVFVYFLGLLGTGREQALAWSLLFFGLQVITALVGGWFELKLAVKKSADNLQYTA